MLGTIAVIGVIGCVRQADAGLPLTIAKLVGPYTFTFRTWSDGRWSRKRWVRKERRFPVSGVRILIQHPASDSTLKLEQVAEKDARAA